MTMESLLKLAEAAGFAMASDESEQTWRAPRAMPLAQKTAPSPRDVLNFSRDPDAERVAQRNWTRAPLASFLPSWYAKI
jgi:hypothetical protein